MSEKQKKRLIEESDLAERNSVYDFLYHDIHRIGSFLSQFDKNGLLTSHTHTLKTTAAEQSGYSTDIKGGIEPIVSSRLSETQSTNSSRAKDFAKTYNPLWQNSLTFLDYLENKQLLNHDIFGSNIGQFVLIKGQLFVFDVGFIHELLLKPASRTGFINGFVETATNKDTANQDAHEVVDIITTFPKNLIQSKLVGDKFYAWSTLRNEGLCLSTNDLMLKHGAKIAGEWHLLGILDALPDTSESDTVDLSVLSVWQTNLAKLALQLQPRLGRDPDSYGITPLLIFREVTGNYTQRSKLE